MQLALDMQGGGCLALPQHLEPMLTRSTAEAFDSPDYLFEIRWDGIRSIALIEDGELRLRNRRLGEIGQMFPELQQLRHAVTVQPVILDGEIVIVDEQGRPNFDALQHRLSLTDPIRILNESRRRPACYLAYDLLFKGMHWLIGEPLSRRKRVLGDTVQQAECVFLSEYFEAEGTALFQAAEESELEGIIAKAKGSAYTPGARTPHWLSVQRAHRGEFIVGGYSVHISGGQRTTQLLLGAFDDDGTLLFVGTVAPPAGEPQRTELFAVLNSLQIEEPPFDQPPRFIGCWVRPEVVITVTYGRWDRDRGLRHAVFERVRLDVCPDECLLPTAVTPLPPELDGEQPGERPHLTVLSTLRLPLPEQPVPRPFLRVVDSPPPSKPSDGA